MAEHEYIIAKRTQPTAPKVGRGTQEDPKGLKDADRPVRERPARISFILCSPEEFAALQKQSPGEWTEAK